MDVAAELREFNRVYLRVMGGVEQAPNGAGRFTESEVRAVAELSRRKRPTHVQALREELGVTAAHLSRLLRRLEELGLVERERSTLDARHQQVCLTEAGWKLAGEMEAGVTESILRRLRGCSGVRREKLAQALHTARSMLAGPPGVAAELREARPGDLGWIVWAHGEWYDAEHGRGAEFVELAARTVADFTATCDPARERAWIAALDGRPVGCVMCVRGADTARMRLLLVDPAARGYGLGARLVRACVDFAREAGCGELTAEVDAEFGSARGLCTRLGFTPAGGTERRLALVGGTGPST